VCIQVPLDPESFPTNVSFELDDINHGLAEAYENHFDVIHMRCVMAGIKDMKVTLHDLERCMRPGGLLVVVDGDTPVNESREGYMKVAKEEGDDDVSGVNETGSWVRRIMWGS
jgi:ubiquinone/menaquinone biosynthesis C-methylase UbiE